MIHDCFSTIHCLCYDAITPQFSALRLGDFLWLGERFPRGDSFNSSVLFAIEHLLRVRFS